MIFCILLQAFQVTSEAQVLSSENKCDKTPGCTKGQGHKGFCSGHGVSQGPQQDAMLSGRHGVAKSTIYAT